MLVNRLLVNKLEWLYMGLGICLWEGVFVNEMEC